MVAPASTIKRQPVSKATVQCLDCGHESHISGDWLIPVLADSLTYEYPFRNDN